MLKKLFSQGVLYSIGIFINRVVPSRCFRFRIFRVFQLGELPEDQVWRIKPEDGISFRWCATDEEIAAARKKTYFDAPASESESGDRLSAFLALDQEEPIGGVWRAKDWFDESELSLRVILNTHFRWVFAAYIDETHRRRGIYRSLLQNVLVADEFVTFASINPTNKSSMAAHQSFIRETVGTCVVARVGRYTVCWTAGGLSNDRTFSTSPSQPIEIRIGNT